MAAAALYGGWQQLLQMGSQPAQYLRSLVTQYPPTTYFRNANTINFIPFNTPNELPPYIHSPPETSPKPEAAPANKRKYSGAVDLDSPVIKQQKLNDREELSDFYQCDLCEFQNPDGKIVFQHLKDSNHISYSRYQLLPDNVGNVTTVLMKPNVATIKVDSDDSDSEFCDLMAVCPTCYMPFIDKFLCGYHHQLHHNREAAYLICKVELDVQVPVKDCICESCDLKFNRSSKLHAHWLSKNWLCSPFPKLHITQNHVILLNCTFCKTKSYRFISPTTEYHSVLLSFKNHVFNHVVDKNLPVLIRMRLVKIGDEDHLILPPMINQKHDDLMEMLKMKCYKLRLYYKNCFALAKTFLNRVRMELDNLDRVLIKDKRKK